jgi:Domain of unknown function (DU1801)
MAQANNKTIANKASVADFVRSIDDKQKRADCKAIMKVMAAASGKRATMWGANIIGYGQYHYKYESGREGDFMRVGLSPRTNNISIYIIPGFGKYQSLLEKLGKYKTGKSCLYIKRLDDVNIKVLQKIIEDSLRVMKARYPVA